MRESANSLRSFYSGIRNPRRPTLPCDDLRDWIKLLDKSSELRRIREEVSRVLMNQYGSERRMKLALGLDPDKGSLDEIANRIRALLEIKSPEGLLEKLKMLPQLAAIGNIFPKTTSAKDAPCKEVILRDNFSLLNFPILQCWPLDGGRFITLPCVITRDPRTGKRNMGMYRMQVYDGQTTGMHWQRQKNAAEHLREKLRAQAADATARVTAMAETAGATTNLAIGNIN